MDLPLEEEQIFWHHKPKWLTTMDGAGWGWEGNKLQGNGEWESVTQWLQPEEFGKDERPLKNLKPPSSGRSGHQSTLAPRSASLNQSGYDTTQQTSRYPASSAVEEEDQYGTSPPSNYQLQGENTRQGRSGQESAADELPENGTHDALSYGHRQGDDVPGSGQTPVTDQTAAGYNQSQPGNSSNSGYYDPNVSYQPYPSTESRSSYAQNSQYHEDKSTSRRHHRSHGKNKKSSYEQPIPEHYEARHQQRSSPSGYQDAESSIRPDPYTHSRRGGNGFDVQRHNNQSYGSGSMQVNQGSGSYGNNSPYVAQGGSFSGGFSSNAPTTIPPIRLSSNTVESAPRIGQTRNSFYLDPQYRIHASYMFKPGKIISVMWAEAEGKSKPRGPNNSRLSRVTLAEHKKNFYMGFRRFIIIKNHQGHCTGVPIYTHQGQGCNKPGVKADQHGVIYEDLPGNTGALLPNEGPLGFNPIRATTEYGVAVKEASRVNYSKLVTIYHNREVLFVADVHAEDWNIVENAVRSYFA